MISCHSSSEESQQVRIDDTAQFVGLTQIIAASRANPILPRKANADGCDPNLMGCEELDITLEAMLDISHCADGLASECLLVGSMKVTVCTTENILQEETIEVNFEEEFIAHDVSSDCIIDFEDHHDDEHHGDFFDCELEVFYDHFILC